MQHAAVCSKELEAKRVNRHCLESCCPICVSNTLMDWCPLSSSAAGLVSAQDDAVIEYPDATDPVAALRVFPNCDCDSYRCTDGPYRLTSAASRPNNAGPNTVGICFRVSNVDCDRKTQCCQKILANLGKVEFEVGECWMAPASSDASWMHACMHGRR